MFKDIGWYGLTLLERSFVLYAVIQLCVTERQVLRHLIMQSLSSGNPKKSKWGAFLPFSNF